MSRRRLEKGQRHACVTLALFVKEMKKGRGVMAEMEDVLAELRHRIMGQLKPAQPQHQETPAIPWARRR